MHQNPPSPPPEPEKSELEKLIESRERRCWSYSADAFLSKGKGGFGQIRIRCPNVTDINTALLAARKHCIAYAKETGLDNDPVYTENVRLVYILNLVCRNAERDQPAFQGPKWMMDHLTPDECAVLHNLYEQTLLLETPLDLGLNDEKVETMASALAALTDEGKLAEYLATFSREVMSFFLIRLASKLKDARDEIESMRAAPVETPADEPLHYVRG
jgi:hypothetical protein